MFLRCATLQTPAGMQPEARSESAGPPSPERIRRFRVFAASWLVLSFFSVFAGEQSHALLVQPPFAVGAPAVRVLDPVLNPAPCMGSEAD